MMISEREQLIQYIYNRKIEHLFHFTNVKNLSSILTHGLLGLTALEEKKINFTFNDELRLDNMEHAISTSISFPNYLMFYKYRMTNPAEQWIVLKLKASILWEKTCVFCPDNAANSVVKNTPIIQKTGLFGLQRMFCENSRGINRSELTINTNMSTNPQAEVLVCESIGIEYIESIIFNSRDTVKNLCSNNQLNPIINKLISFECDNTFFSPRNDSDFWTKKTKLA